jgi:hypothetical protein
VETARVRYRSIAADNERWDGFTFRDGDIIISTPPKCGTTWTQMICALLIFQKPDLPTALDLISPWLEMLLRARDDVVADLEAQRHRRFIKSHTPFDGLPYDERVTYVCVGRDPRDVALSWDNHVSNLDFPALLALREAVVGNDDLAELMQKMQAPAPSLHERFWQWVDDPTPVTDSPAGLASTLNHLSTFFESRMLKNIVLLHFAELKADPEGQMRKLAVRLGIEVAEDLWPELVHAASFEEMRRRVKDVGPNQTESIWLERERFFNRGTNGQWRDVLTEDDLRRYEARVMDLASPALSAWMHQGAIIDR